MKQPLVVLGHNNIDVDSAISAILLVKLLNFKGVDAHFKILDEKIGQDTYDCLSKLGYNLDEYKDFIRSARTLVTLVMR